MTAQRDPLRASLTEELGRIRGDGRSPPPALLDVVREVIAPGGGAAVDLLRPRDWDALRHQEGAEGRGAPYWAQLWPSGLALADALAGRDELAGRRVLELGCGLGLPSVVAARAGARVVATDASPGAVVFTGHNLAINGLEGKVAATDWRAAEALVDGAPWHAVIAADVLYLRHNVEALLRLLPRLVDGDGEILLADPSRAGGRDFLAAARGLFDAQSRADGQRPRVNLHVLRRQ